MAKFYTVELLYEGGGTLRINEDHIVAVKQRTNGGYRLWLSTTMEIGDDPDRLYILSGQADEARRNGAVQVLNVKSVDLDLLFPPAADV